MGPSGASLGRSWAFFGRFLGLRNEAFIKHWSKMVSKRPSGSILEGFGEGSGGFGEGLGRILANLGMDFGKNLIWDRILARVQEFAKSCDRVSK